MLLDTSDSYFYFYEFFHKIDFENERALIFCSYHPKASPNCFLSPQSMLAMMDSPQLRMLRNSIAMRKPNFIRKISRPSNSSNFQGSVHSSLGSGESQGRPNRKASRLSTGPGSGVQTNSTQFAKELAVAMPDYKIQFDQNGELKIMRREAGKKLDKESIKRIIVQKAHNVKAKVRKKAESHSGRASMDVVDKKNLSLRRESIDKVLEKKASKVSSVRLSSRVRLIDRSI